MQKAASIDRHARCSKIDAISKNADMLFVVEAGGGFMPCLRSNRWKSRRHRWVILLRKT
jgi:hypothetical protein